MPDSSLLPGYAGLLMGYWAPSGLGGGYRAVCGRYGTRAVCNGHGVPGVHGCHHGPPTGYHGLPTVCYILEIPLHSVDSESTTQNVTLLSFLPINRCILAGIQSFLRQTGGIPSDSNTGSTSYSQPG